MKLSLAASTRTDFTSGFRAAYKGRRVFVTGHTGFKGSWLCQWLLSLGAEVTGLSLPPDTKPALFEQLGLARRIERHLIGDIRDLALLKKRVREARPDFLFHLAAQPLVRLSYQKPVETFESNVLGTAHILESLRSLDHCAAVMVTTDKCYENREWFQGYRETDRLGGHDPYSASKAAAELVIASYRKSFFSRGAIRVASARAGNVLGGGDWAADRILPDAIRALRQGKPIGVRNPRSTRPWQHVLEPLSGYLLLGATLQKSPARPACDAFNFGPPVTSNRTVGELVTEVLANWPGKWRRQSQPKAPHEAGLLHLSTEKAWQLLGWKPVWEFSETIARTVSWYRNVAVEKAEPGELTLEQIIAFHRAAREKGLDWSL